MRDATNGTSLRSDVKTRQDNRGQDKRRRDETMQSERRRERILTMFLQCGRRGARCRGWCRKWWARYRRRRRPRSRSAERRWPAPHCGASTGSKVIYGHCGFNDINTCTHARLNAQVACIIKRSYRHTHLLTLARSLSLLYYLGDGGHGRSIG